jgi:hypothetical protein
MILDELAVLLGVKQDSASFARADMALKKLGVNAAKAQSGIKKSTDGFFSKISAGLGVSSASLGLAAATTAAVSFGKKVVSSFSEIHNSAQRLGVTAEAIQFLRFAADQSGVGIDGIQSSMRNFVLSGHKSIGVLREFGVTAAQLKGLSIDQQFEKVAIALSKITDPSKRVKATAAVFGSREAMNLQPLIANAGNLQSQRADVHRWAVPSDTVNKIEAIGSKIDRVFAMTFGRVSTFFAKIIIWADAFFERNSESINKIASAVSNIFSAIAPILGAAIAILEPVLSLVLSTLADAFTLISELKEPLLIIAGIAATAFLPVVTTVAAIVAAVYLVRLAIRRWILIIRSVKDELKDVWGRLVSGFDRVKDSILGVPAALARAFESLWENIKSVPGRLRAAIPGLDFVLDRVGLSNNEAPTLGKGEISRNTTTSKTANVTINTGSGDPQQIANKVSAEIQKALGFESRNIATSGAL